MTRHVMRPRPGKAELDAARGRAIGDVLPRAGEPIAVLFCGINPSLYSGATGHHFARPGNRFWPALHRSGCTDRQLAPHEQDLLPSYGLGITNLVDRATARADELSEAELRAGGERLAALVARVSPRYVAVAGVTAYRIAFGSRRTSIGPQPGTLGPAILGACSEPLRLLHSPAGASEVTGFRTSVWLLPNPSGLNASWTLDRIAAELRRLKDAADVAGLCQSGPLPESMNPDRRAGV
jgi:TDG/mug DNA glycosylase family protein